MHGVNNVRKREMHRPESSVIDTSSSVVETIIEKFDRYESPGIYQISAELIQAGGVSLRCESQKLN
jgi:hypothetical protein